MSKGSKNCRFCLGRGVVRGVNGWRACSCQSTSRELRETLARAHELATGRKPLTIDQMLRMRDSDR